MIHAPVAAERNIKTVAEKGTNLIYLKSPMSRGQVTDMRIVSITCPLGICPLDIGALYAQEIHKQKLHFIMSGTFFQKNFYEFCEKCHLLV